MLELNLLFPWLREKWDQEWREACERRTRGNFKSFNHAFARHKFRHQLYPNCTVCIDVPALIDGAGVSWGWGGSAG